MEKQIICLCDCGSFEHQIIFTKDEDGIIWVHYNLSNSNPFFKRLIIGVKYMFGFKSKYGSFGEVVLRQEDEIKLKNLLNENRTKGN